MEKGSSTERFTPIYWMMLAPILLVVVAFFYFLVTRTFQQILDNDAQFTMLVSLLVFILTYCLFINRVRGRIVRDDDLETDRRSFLVRQACWLTVATIVLFLSLLLCLVRISVVLLQSNPSSCLLADLDGSVIFTLWIALLLSIAIFIDAYWLEKEPRNKTKDSAQSPSREERRN